MNRLALHIISLLRLYDSVALPGFGVLTMKYVPARLDSESYLFLPPFFDLRFFRGDTSFDSLLIDSYIRKEECSPLEAEEMLTADLTNLSATLDIRGKATLHGLGTFFIEDGKPEFIASLCLNPPLPTLATVEEDSQETEEKEETTQMTVALETAEALETEIEKAPSPYFRHPDYYYIPIHKKLAKIAACLLLVVLVGLAAIIPVNAPKNPPATASILPISVNEQQRADTLAAEPVAPVESTDTVAEEVTPKKLEGTYHAIVAAFKTHKEVERFIADHPKEAKYLQVIDNRNFHLISVSADTDRSELEARMPMIRTSYPDAWIYTLP